MSQEQLAIQFMDLTGTNMTAATVSRIEQRKSPYSQRQLEAFALILDCTPADLLARDPNNKDADDLLWSRLKPHQKATARQIIKGILNSDGEAA